MKDPKDADEVEKDLIKKFKRLPVFVGKSKILVGNPRVFTLGRPILRVDSTAIICRFCLKVVITI